MSTYTPDEWVLIEIKPKDSASFEKILACWYGGFAGSNSWKLSSGNLEAYIEGGFIVFPQESGSIYKCSKDTQRMGGYLSSVYSDLKKSAESAGAKLEITKYVL